MTSSDERQLRVAGLHLFSKLSQDNISSSRSMVDRRAKPPPAAAPVTGCRW